MKVSELEGAALDYWVARALGWRRDGRLWRGARGIDGVDRINSSAAQQFVTEFRPSTNWAKGGPLLDEYDIMFESSDSQVLGNVFAYIEQCGSNLGYYGMDRLEAAMRCIVASVYGDEVPEVTE